jgi:hypothetical protein
VTGAEVVSLRTLAFGDLDTGVWGVAAAWGSEAVASFAAELTIEAGADDWFVAHGGLELRFSPLAEPGELRPSAAGVDGFAQLCRVEGAVHRDGAEHDVSCLGMRAAIAGSPPAFGSVRVGSGWLAPDQGFALAALRPPRAAGHDKDALACAIFEDGAALAIDEPRLSTTYDDDGWPARASLEVWLEDLQVEGEEDRPQYPRRFAGTVDRDRTRVPAAGFELRAELFRWRARGGEGPGVYVLAQPR